MDFKGRWVNNSLSPSFWLGHCIIFVFSRNLYEKFPFVPPSTKWCLLVFCPSLSVKLIHDEHLIWFFFFCRTLIELVKRFGLKKWTEIAKLMNGRIGKQCRERWYNNLRGNIKVYFLSIYVLSLLSQNLDSR